MAFRVSFNSSVAHDGNELTIVSLDVSKRAPNNYIRIKFFTWERVIFTTRSWVQ